MFKPLSYQTCERGCQFLLKDGTNYQLMRDFLNHRGMDYIQVYTFVDAELRFLCVISKSLSAPCAVAELFNGLKASNLGDYEVVFVGRDASNKSVAAHSRMDW